MPSPLPALVHVLGEAISSAQTLNLAGVSGPRRFWFQATVSGSAALEHRGKTHRVGVGRATFMPVPAEASYRPSGCRSVYISVKGPWVDDLAEGLSKKFGPVVNLPKGSRALKIAREAILSAPLGFFHSDYASAAFACRFVLGLMEDLEGPPPGEKSAMVESALAFMNKQFGDDLTTAHMARGLGVSREHFTRGFKQQMGMGPGEYLSRTRLGEAAALLTQTALSHREISARTGFSDASTFARAFRRRFGASPEQWRKGPL